MRVWLLWFGIAAGASALLWAFIGAVTWFLVVDGGSL